jgi:hypothetical protein
MNLKRQKEKHRRRARKLAEEAWQAAEEGNLDLAEKIIRRAVATQIDNPVLWNDQGVLLLRRDREIEAEASFRAALRLAPTFADAYANLAALKARQGFPEQAVALQTRAVEHAPTDLHRQRLADYQAQAGEARARLQGTAPSAVDDAVSPPSPAAPLPGEPVIDWPARLSGLDWNGLGERLTRDGCATIPALVDADTCAWLRGLFDHDALFAKTVVMDGPEFGQGVYRYFAPPVPEVVQGLRRAVYAHLAAIANHWQELLGETERFPPTWDAFRERCHDAGQARPTPILLRYGPGGFNALHRDLRGSVFFPIQLVVVLSPRADQPGGEKEGFTGGSFLFCDVPERAKARRREIAAGLGDAVLFCTRDRLARVGGIYGLQPVKHGVTPITAGTRIVLGIPFHEYR